MATMALENAPGKRRRSRQLQVDFTPLVDLGFLLITFFVFTSSMQVSSGMQVYVPKPGEAMDIAESGALSILPDNGGFWYYAGKTPTTRDDMRYVPTAELPAFRQLLVQANQQQKHPHPLMVIIKPTGKSSFGQVVGILNEMTICQINSYALTEAEEGELAMLQ